MCSTLRLHTADFCQDVAFPLRAAVKTFHRVDDYDCMACLVSLCVSVDVHDRGTEMPVEHEGSALL